ncbi:MAG TPA: hypothetical protein VK582_16490 [Pyrinomonadaceae bacterium]|nr:hypothetical protein [Pyrinomonadaceae bacterium]
MGKAPPVEGFNDMAIFEFAWSPDLVYDCGAITRDIALLRNLKLPEPLVRYLSSFA